MKAQKKLLLVAVLTTLAGVAYAADSETTTITNTQSVSASMATSDATTYNSYTDVDINEVFDPKGGMGGLAEANITSVQKNLGNSVYVPDPSTANFNHSADNNAGNVGANNAAGFFNNQANNVSIAQAKPAKTGGANAKVDSEQLNAHDTANFGNNAPSTGLYPLNDMHANVLDSVNHNDGNVGVNNAAGAFNAQGNNLAIASADNDALASAHSTSLQTNLNNSLTSTYALTTGASVDGSGNHNAGNVGLNNAAGIANAQVNTLSMATAK